MSISLCDPVWATLMFSICCHVLIAFVFMLRWNSASPFITSSLNRNMNSAAQLKEISLSCSFCILKRRESSSIERQTRYKIRLLHSSFANRRFFICCHPDKSTTTLCTAKWHSIILKITRTFEFRYRSDKDFRSWQIFLRPDVVVFFIGATSDFITESETKWGEFIAPMGVSIVSGSAECYNCDYKFRYQMKN